MKKEAQAYVGYRQICRVWLVWRLRYSRKIKFDYSSIYSINIHPSILPNGRGPDAAAWISLKHRNFAGFTFHKISDEFDEGDIVAQCHISLAENDGWEIYMAKLKIEIIRALPDLLENFKESYGAAKPQSSGSSWPPITAMERLIHWDMPHEKIHSIILSFGRWGAIVQTGSQYLLVNNLELSVYQHGLPAGNILSSDAYSITVSTSEGLAIIPKKCVVREILLTEACSLGLPIR